MHIIVTATWSDDALTMDVEAASLDHAAALEDEFLGAGADFVTVEYR